MWFCVIDLVLCIGLFVKIYCEIGGFKSSGEVSDFVIVLILLCFVLFWYLIFLVVGGGFV